MANSPSASGTVSKPMLKEWIEEVHEALANVMLGMVILHVLGVLWASYAHRENLVRSMLCWNKARSR